MSEPTERPPESQVTPKTVFTVAACMALVLGVIYFLFETQLAVFITLFSVLLAVALDRAVEFLQRRKLPRGVAIAVVFAGTLLAVVAIGLLIIPTAIEQGQALAQHGPELMQRLRDAPVYQKLNSTFQLDQRLQRLEAGPGSLLSSAVQPALAALGSVVKFVVVVVTILFAVLFMLIWGGALVQAALAESLPWRREVYARVLHKSYRSVGGYLGGLTFLAVLNATFTSIFLAIMDVPYFLPLAILSGLGSLVPFLGATVAGAILTAVALATKGTVTGVGVLIYFLVYQQVENHLFAPVVYKQTVNMNPLVTLLALIFFGDLYGVVGGIMAVPLVAVFQIVLREWLALRREQWGLAPLPPPPAKGAP